MTRKKTIKIAVVVGVILLLMLAMHLIGSTIFPMMKHHLGL